MNGDCKITKHDHIPADIISDILSKLPSKSILRFKTACKTWYSLIPDPGFINLRSQNPKILFYTSLTQSQLQLLDYERPSFDGSCLSGPISFRGQTRLNHARIIGSSCGLVCVDTRDVWENRFSIWNPFTGECRKIPNLTCVVTKELKYSFYGLGYDSVANDFKLVITLYESTTGKIFSLKANSWKSIEFPSSFNFSYPPWHPLAVVSNGIFHWFVTRSNSREIVAFDINKETFGRLELPQMPQDPHGATNLLEHRGCLCVSKLQFFNDTNKLWIMKEYGVWVPWLTIKNPPEFKFYRSILSISTRNEFVFHKGMFMRCGMEEDDKLEEIGINHRFYGAVSYVESLVSPNFP